LADSLRPESAQVAAELKEMGLRIIMMTGDNQTVASAVGRSLKLDMTYTDSLPQHKLRHLRNLMHDYGKVAMVGDGINDTPALAAAHGNPDGGGAGTPQALETADVVLMSDDLRGLPWVIGLARFARRLIRQNVALSFAIKAVFLLLAFNGVTSLWMAILADVGMSLLVTLNGMRPLAYRQV
jgi:Zn2+/Cd2+-exporting ATPase